MPFHLSATIVTYHNNPEVLLKAVNSVLATDLDVCLYIVDNSKDDSLKSILPDTLRLSYLFQNSNKGFGAGHNTILRDSAKLGKYHLVLNPDVSFQAGTLESLYQYMENNPDVGNVMPCVVYPDGRLQYLCKLLPTPMDWIIRMLVPIKSLKEKIDYNFEMHFADYTKEMNVPYLSGCFMFLRTSVIEEIGGFDEGIFMYGEDTDLNRRIYQKYRTMYWPVATITHHFEKGSHKKIRLLWIHIKAAIYYLNKWGWIIDKERTSINKKTKSIYLSDNCI